MIRELMEEQIRQAENTKDRLFLIGMLLFATKGYNAVGIREICRCADIKESSFYNHYKGKAALLDAILDAFIEMSNDVVYSEDEIKLMIEEGDVDAFLEYNMQKFAASYGFPTIHTGLLIVYMERFTNEKAHSILKMSGYNKWKEPTERILQGLIDKGAVKQCDVGLVTMEYYYALSGIVEEFIQLVAWEEDITTISNRIQVHMDYYKAILKEG